MRITWVGHSTVVVRDEGIRLLTDPVLRGRVAHLRRVESVDLRAVDAVDVVVISHAHRDHLDVPSLRLIPRGLPVVVPRGVGCLVARLGFSDVTELDVGGCVTFGALEVQATHAEHDGRRNPLGRATPSLGYLLSGSARVYFAGDTDVFDGMRELAQGLDIAVLPIAGWGPRIPAGHLDPERAAHALSLLRPRLAIPVHWGTYRRLGLSRDAAAVREPLDEFLRLVPRFAPDVAVEVLHPGETVDVSTHLAAP